MGKARRQPRKHSNHHDNPTVKRATIVRRQHSQKAQPPNQKPAAKANDGSTQQPRRRIPFTRHDNVLLVGEGDFSFSLSLKRHHKVGSIVATCFDGKTILHDKYPQAEATINALQPLNKDASSPLPDAEWKGFSPPPEELLEESRIDGVDDHRPATSVVIMYGVDATKLSTNHKKALKPHAPFTKIIFNFPHVGGLSTDINRQVRYNQELLVGFFKAAKGLLVSQSRQAEAHDTLSGRNVHDSWDEEESSADDVPRPANGQILVTLFEGEPYSLWNVRDLARHCGLRVVESFKFPWSAYPGYQHARTLGDITTGKDRSEEGKRKGAWRGEERDARCYMLEDKNSPVVEISSAKRKRKHGSDESD